MDERIKSVIKIQNKLIVPKAMSLENEVRFYVNKIQYFVATPYDDNSVIVNLGEEENENEKNRDKKTWKYFNENCSNLITAFIKYLEYLFFKNFSFYNMMIIVVLLFSLLYYKDFSFIYLFFIYFSHTMYLCITIISAFAISIKYDKISSSLRSTHSAEHMIVNFLEKYNRLPENMKELKKSSPFSINCGSLSILEDLTYSLISLFSICFYSSITILLFEDLRNTFSFFLCYLFYCILFAIVPEINLLGNLLKYLIAYIFELNFITKNVQDFDLYLAYCAALFWIRELYPEFYNFEDKSFMESVFNDNNNHESQIKK